MKRIILFRFHKFPKVCLNHINILHKYNPNIEIFGIYGGKPENYENFKKILENKIKNIFDYSHQTKKWKWENGDLAVRDWYQQFGKNIPFDMLHLIEWDMLFFSSLDKIYSHIPKDSIGLTGLIPLKLVEKKWDWTSEEPYKSRWLKLLQTARTQFNYNQEPYGCIFGGACFSRYFLEKYSKIEIIKLCHDELRTPLFAQILKVQLVDTKLANVWFDAPDEKYFNANNKDVDIKLIEQELQKSKGRRVFHPYRKIYNFPLIP